MKNSRALVTSDLEPPTTQEYDRMMDFILRLFPAQDIAYAFDHAPRHGLRQAFLGLQFDVEGRV